MILERLHYAKLRLIAAEAAPTVPLSSNNLVPEVALSLIDYWVPGTIELIRSRATTGTIRAN